LIITEQPDWKKELKTEGFIMENECVRSFDLPTLLKIDGLDIQMLAENDLSLQTGDYYKLLSRFVDYAPDAVDTINRIASLGASESDFWIMEIIKNKLESIGCYKIMLIVNDITAAGKKGQTKYAAFCAKKILDDFYDLYAGILNAEKIPEAEATSDADKPCSLYKALELLEQEEAAPKMRILAVDDSPVMLKTISSVLGDDYIVYGMSDPLMLDKFLQQITPELILLDIEMPGMNGFEVMTQLKANDSYSKIPVVFLSAMNDAANEAYGLELGAAGFIHKPIQANILREKVAKHIAETVAKKGSIN
jgi:PleD family two-component response regulator